MTIDAAALPKAVLHEHLDGGLRVGTILEIAAQTGYDRLPSTDPGDLEEWFHQGRSGSLERYLEAFEHTVGVMQTPEALERVAYEAVEDLARDGVVYAEIRFAPSLNTQGGLSREAVLEATWKGMSKAMEDHDIVVYQIVTAMRQESDAREVADTAIRMRDHGIVGFDLAGPEAGFPPDRHLDACNAVREAGLGLTLHAGEGDGQHSIWRALALCGADRIGHGVHIVEDTDFDGATISKLGSFARRVRDHRVPLEVAVTSNIHTGTFESAETHPLSALYRSGFNVSINTDNRLMSGVSMSGEYRSAHEDAGLTLADLGAITEHAILAGFGDYPVRKRLIEDVVRPAYGS